MQVARTQSQKFTPRPILHQQIESRRKRRDLYRSLLTRELPQGGVIDSRVEHCNAFSREADFARFLFTAAAAKIARR